MTKPLTDEEQREVRAAYFHGYYAAEAWKKYKDRAYNPFRDYNLRLSWQKGYDNSLKGM